MNDADYLSFHFHFLRIMPFQKVNKVVCDVRPRDYRAHFKHLHKLCYLGQMGPQNTMELFHPSGCSCVLHCFLFNLLGHSVRYMLA